MILLWAAGLSLFEAVCHSFTTLATGGFSTRTQSIGEYSTLVQYIVICFMFLAGTNFSLHYMAVRGRLTAYFRDEEFRVYLLIIVAAIVLIFFNLRAQIGGALEENFRWAAFQVISIKTSTGYVNADYDLWPTFSRMMLLILMAIGGCGGSTAAGLKGIRVIILFKSLLRELKRLAHPNRVISIKMNGSPVSDVGVNAIITFTFAYFLILVVSALAISFSGLDMITAFSAVFATIGNVGPALGDVGPYSNYAGLENWVKLILIADMWLGRLEIFTVLMVFIPSTWRK